MVVMRKPKSASRKRNNTPNRADLVPEARAAACGGGARKTCKVRRSKRFQEARQAVNPVTR